MPADSLRKARTPEPFSTSRTSNWVARAGGLPPYIQHIAHDLMEKRGKDESTAIRMAIGIVKRWARGGGNVDAGTKAAAQLAVSQWMAMRARTAAKRSARATEADVDVDDWLTEAALARATAILERAWEERLHPRDSTGRFVHRHGILATRSGFAPIGHLRVPAHRAGRVPSGATPLPADDPREQEFQRRSELARAYAAAQEKLHGPEDDEEAAPRPAARGPSYFQKLYTAITAGDPEAPGDVDGRLSAARMAMSNMTPAEARALPDHLLRNLWYSLFIGQRRSPGKRAVRAEFERRVRAGKITDRMPALHEAARAHRGGALFGMGNATYDVEAMHKAAEGKPLVDVDPRQFAHAFGEVRIDPVYAMKTNIGKPVLLAAGPNGGTRLVDGWHRAYKAAHTGKGLRGRVLSEHDMEACRVTEGVREGHHGDLMARALAVADASLAGLRVALTEARGRASLGVDAYDAPFD